VAIRSPQLSWLGLMKRVGDWQNGKAFTQIPPLSSDGNVVPACQLLKRFLIFL
jgi:hypothetical protein